METYETKVNGLEYYQVNTKRNTKHCLQLPTYLFDIHISEKDEIEIEIDYPEKEACHGLFKLLILAPNGRVIKSIKRIQDKEFSDMYDYENTKFNSKFIIDVVPGKYTLKYWAIDCDDCNHYVKVKSMNNQKSIVKCCRRKKLKR